MYPPKFGQRLLDIMVPILWIVIVAALVRLKLHQLSFLRNDPVFGLYSLLTTSYLLSRLLCLIFYHPYHPYHSRPGPLGHPRHIGHLGYPGYPGYLGYPGYPEYSRYLGYPGYSDDFYPSVTIVIPTMNEEKAIFGTIEACCSLDYPEDRLEIIVINDGSTDETWREIARAMDTFPRVEAVNWTTNRGKRAGMVEGIRRSQSEIIVFIDSDSVVERGSLKTLVQPFVDPNVAAVVGHADVLNRDRNLLTRMQAARYFISFRIMKASESVFNSVTCCSGCYSAYRRSAVLGILNEWQNQTFLGRKCTFGDDRSLTNLLLREGYSLLYASEARVKTIVPETWRGYLKQQLRWKKSWFRETLIAVTHMWRRNPGASIPYYLSVLFTFCSPLVLLRSLLLSAASRWAYLGGLAILGAVYGLYYRIHRRDGLWPYAFVFVFLNAFVFSWQIYQAILTSTNTSWGTRQVKVGRALNTKAVEAER